MKVLWVLERWCISTERAHRAFRKWPERTYAAPLPVGYGRAYRCIDRNADVVAREPYRTILAAAHWWMRHRWIIEEGLIRINLLRSPVEGDWYENFRFDPPDLWGTPLRRHEIHG